MPDSPTLRDSSEPASQDDLTRNREMPSTSGSGRNSLSTAGGSDATSHHETAEFQPIIADKGQLERQASNASRVSQDKLIRALSRRKSSATAADEDKSAQYEIDRLISRMFGEAHHGDSQAARSRHLGVIFKDLTVKGVGVGATLQPTVGDIFLTLPRLIASKISGKGGRVHKPAPRTILHHITGAIRPGEMLLVLGRPGSGCSTFLKTLGNQRAEYQAVEGSVTYGGTDAHTMAKHYRGEVLYNPEDDLHYGPLTVRKTLEFALKTRMPSKESRPDGESPAEYTEEFLRDVTQLFWITHTLDTRVGDERIRGVSGGEKKRVSIAEAMITKASAQMWDNSTRGLDSSTALEYVLGLRSVAHMAQVSTAVALYQAGESLYELFDKVILLDEGRCCFYGKTEDAAEYFESLGFERPPRWTTADFITSVTDPHARHVKAGWEDRIPRTSGEFEDAYRRSAMAQKTADDVADFERELEEHRQERERHEQEVQKKNYTLPFYQQVIACTERQFAVIRGDIHTIGTRWCGITFLALIVGSLFYDLPKTSRGVFTRGGVMFFTILFNALLAMVELGGCYKSRPIMLKHKTFSFYRPAAYALSLVLMDLLLGIVQVLLWNIVVYFMSGLQRTASQFFISSLLIYLVVLTMYSFFRAAGSLSGSLDIASRFTGLAIQAFTVYTGYLIPPDKMHPWFSWIRWINPVGYAFEGLMANEFYDLTLECVSPNLVPQGPGAAPEYQSCTVLGSKPGEIVVSGANYISTAYGYSRSHLWRNVGIIIAFWVAFIFMSIVGMESNKPANGGGVVTVFQRGQLPKSVEKAVEQGEVIDEEKPAKSQDGIMDRSSASESSGKGVQGHSSVFTFQHVNYTIPVKDGTRQLLNNIHGCVRPGRLTALMGSSGAGKTTLLNTLAQRINFGVVSGDFLVDGRPLPKSFQRSTGFAEQMDIHEPTATVREALRFSALLRRPSSVSVQEKYDYVEKIIDLLEMRDIAGATIGRVGSGLAQEQRKRVTIGVELASKPDLLLFLDEPTSGLDSQAAYNIIRFLRKLASAGQAILCTIHQPSAVLFEEFDDLLLLKSGGRTVYNGPLGTGSRDLIDYFESNGAKKCPTAMNPAEYMLEAIGAGDPNYKGPDWGEIWEASPHQKKLHDEIEEIVQRRRDASSEVVSLKQTEFAMPLWTQIVAVTKRNFISFWRTPQYIIGKFALHIITGLFNSFTFYQLGQSTIDMQDRVFAIFLTFTIAPPLIQQLQPRYLSNRAVYKLREANSKIYSWLAFAIGAILPELPYAIVAGTCYFNAWYWPNGFPTGESAGFVWMMIMLFELYYIGFGTALASFAPNEEIAMLLVPIFFLFVSAFSGIVVPYAALPHFWKNWMYWLSPFHYLFEANMGSVAHGIPVRCSSDEFAYFNHPPGYNCDNYTLPYISVAGGYVETTANGSCALCAYSTGDEFAASFNVFYHHRWRDYGIFWAFCVFNFAVFFLGTWYYLVGSAQLKERLSLRQRRQKKQEKSGEKA